VFDMPAREHHSAPEVLVEFSDLGRHLRRAARMLLEAAVVPTLLFYLFLHAIGLVAGLTAVLVWCVLTVAVRCFAGGAVPATLLLAVGVLAGRASLALVFSSAYVYLLQPVLGSILMAGLFVGSALLGKPVTIRLARDFVSLPHHLLELRRVRRMFTQVSLMWGASRVLDAGMSVGFLRYGLDAGLLSRGVFSACLTVLSVLACAWWGWSRMRRIPGLTMRLA
jgi:hypothetical protein